ncbi:MAG: FAD-binding protein, partial [Anaerolineales bacterium]
VAPTAHYSMGGVVVDPETTATTTAGLYAAGEVTSGLHGANRLGGNSLAETVVFGRRAGESAAAYSRSLSSQMRSTKAIDAACVELEEIIKEGDELARPLQRALRNAMWENCGVVRSAERLRHSLEKISELKTMVGSVDVRPSSEGYKDLAIALDLRASLMVAEATARSALARNESRGAHQRYDFPKLDPVYKVNFITTLDEQGEVHVQRQAVPELPPELSGWVEEKEDLPLEGRLLE